MYVRVLIILVGLMSLASCNAARTSATDTASPLQPSLVSDRPDVTTAASAIATIARASRGDVIVNIHDNCDPETFDAAIRPGACVRSGGMQFDQFISILTKLHLVPSWRFAPDIVEAHRGDRFLVMNQGGEVHTFTEVEEFGGGIVADLNQRAGLTHVAPECQSLAAGDFIAPGSTFEDEVEHDEAEKYQCCIHPWMRLTTRVKETH